MKSNKKIFSRIYSRTWVLLTNKTQIALAICTIAILTSCKKNFLDQTTLSVIDENAVFSDSLYSNQFVNSRYTNITLSWEPNRFAGPAGLESACDEAESAIAPTSQSTLISSGALNSSNADKTLWTTTYQQVRAVNIFLKDKSKIPVSDAIKNRWEGEMRFLRAWYYSMMLKHYGGFPIVGDTIYAEGDVINVPRSTYETCVNYITKECDIASNLLPINYLSATNVATIDYGRATKGAALALKARVLLYAASPLTNAARSDDPDHLVSYGAADVNRWKNAADAAQAVINLGQYSLYKAISPAFYSLFTTPVNSQNPEIIFAYYLNPSTTATNFYRESLANPPSRKTSFTGTISCFPLQEMVDAFGMQNGLPITDAASGYAGTGDNMYLNRDPRFYATISYNGALRSFAGYSGDQPIRTYTGVIPTGNTNVNSANLDGIYKTNATRTGYYCYKMLNNNSIGGGSEINRPRILMRYAEILLNAAEATNEFSGPTDQIYTWLKDIRNRAGITAGTNGLYGIKANMTKDEMRAFLQAERRVEFAYEEHRFWDIRRWKIAPTTENRDMHGMEINRAADGSFSYKNIVIRNHVFRDNMYFWPIPQSEITKSSAMKQNPGY